MMINNEHISKMDNSGGAQQRDYLADLGNYFYTPSLLEKNLCDTIEEGIASIDKLLKQKL